MIGLQAARTLGVGHAVLRPFAKRNGIVVAGSGGKGEPMLIREAEVRRLSGELCGLADKTAARKLLGVAKRTFGGLERAGFLPSPALGGAAGLRPGAVWRVADLKKLVASVVGKATRLRGRAPPAGLVGLPTVVRMVSVLGLDMAVVLRMVLDGRRVHP